MVKWREALLGGMFTLGLTCLLIKCDNLVDNSIKSNFLENKSHFAKIDTYKNNKSAGWHPPFEDPNKLVYGPIKEDSYNQNNMNESYWKDPPFVQQISGPLTQKFWKKIYGDYGGENIDDWHPPYEDPNKLIYGPVKKESYKYSTKN